MALALFFAGVGRTTDFSVAIGRLSSELTAKLQLNQPIYIEVIYSSTDRMRFQAQAYRDGKSVDEGQLMNGAIPYPGGTGAALVWVAFRYPAAVDEIRITTYDDDWKPVDTQSLQAKLQWSGKNEGPDQAKPSWVRSLQAEQSKIAVGKVEETRASNVGLLVSLIGLTVMAGVPGYFVIQFIAAHRLRGRWRLASFAPLAMTVPATGYAIYAACHRLQPLAERGLRPGRIHLSARPLCGRVRDQALPIGRFLASGPAGLKGP